MSEIMIQKCYENCKKNISRKPSDDVKYFTMFCCCVLICPLEGKFLQKISIHTETIYCGNKLAFS